eukprot:SAG31_NODE_26632_length_439_cov_0.747059_1_plen_113_part_01
MFDHQPLELFPDVVSLFQTAHVQVVVVAPMRIARVLLISMIHVQQSEMISILIVAAAKAEYHRASWPPDVWRVGWYIYIMDQTRKMVFWISSSLACSAELCAFCNHFHATVTP